MNNVKTTHSLPRSLRNVLILVALLLVATLAFSRQKSESVSGRIIAHDRGLTCLNGNAYWSVIIRLQQAHGRHPRYVRVNLSLPCAELPNWLNAKSSTQQFRLIRDKARDEVLEEFLRCGGESPNGGEPCIRTPAWLRVPDAEREELPFGNIVPAYQFADSPLADIII